MLLVRHNAIRKKKHSFVPTTIFFCGVSLSLFLSHNYPMYTLPAYLSHKQYNPYAFDSNEYKYVPRK